MVNLAAEPRPAWPARAAATGAQAGHGRTGVENLVVLLVAIATSATTLASAVSCLLCLVPRVGAGKPAPHLYFRCVAEYADAAQYEDGLATMLRGGGLFSELADELWTRSPVANDKFEHARLGSFC